MSDVPVQGDIVLVVDDSPETLGFLTSAMEETGVTVLVARSGEAALGIVGKVVPDIILMDAVMPGLDGFETCRALKNMPSVAHVPVIFMTGLTETEHVIHALESGGVDYLNKPINLEELTARIRVHLANARRAQSAHVALDAAGRHLLAASRTGVLCWSTPQASALLGDRTAGPDTGLAAASEAMGDWLQRQGDAPGIGGSFELSRSSDMGLQFTYLGAIGPDEHLFRLVAVSRRAEDEVLRRHFGLTQRESEVLLWIARGKSNRDIAEILGLSPRTVNKHLEQVYAKLGVENRASAAIKATHALQVPSGFAF